MVLVHNAYAYPGFRDTFTNRTGFEIVVYELVGGACQTGRFGDATKGSRDRFGPFYIDAISAVNIHGVWKKMANF